MKTYTVVKDTTPNRLQKWTSAHGAKTPKRGREAKTFATLFAWFELYNGATLTKEQAKQAFAPIADATDDAKKTKAHFYIEYAVKAGILA
jgi:hypothetical protein